jgi:hypothetical protein
VDKGSGEGRWVSIAFLMERIKSWPRGPASAGKLVDAGVKSRGSGLGKWGWEGGSLTS